VPGRLASLKTRLARTRDAATNVHERGRFVGRELVGRPITSVYRLRHSTFRAAIRHPLFDMWVLDEIFRNRAYALPPAVEERLRKLDRPVRVLDLGGHAGLFGLWFRGAFADAQITSYEPDPENVVVLRQAVRINRLGALWSVVEAAAFTSEGSATFMSDGPLSQFAGTPDALRDEHAALEQIFPFLHGRRLLTPREVTVRTTDVMPALAECDFLKLDIQGGEWPLLTDPRFAQLSAVALVIELHPQAAPVDEPLAWTTALLERLGFTLDVMPAHGKERIIWAVRP
jgi:FkbM family methyltransferase